MNALKKSFEKNKYEYLEVQKNIFLINDFVPNKTIKEVLALIENSSQLDWESHYMNGVVDLAKRKYGRSDIENLVSEGLIEITEQWKDKNLSLPFEISSILTKKIKNIFDYDKSLIFDGVGTIQRQYPGAELIEHIDNIADPSIEYAVIMYINDDYTDGELFFNNLDFEIKPMRGSLLIFPSGTEYLHGVRPPGDGPSRYVLPSFVRKK